MNLDELRAKLEAEQAELVSQVNEARELMDLLIVRQRVVDERLKAIAILTSTDEQLGEEIPF